MEVLEALSWISFRMETGRKSVLAVTLGVSGFEFSWNVGGWYKTAWSATCGLWAIYCAGLIYHHHMPLLCLWINLSLICEFLQFKEPKYSTVFHSLIVLFISPLNLRSLHWSQVSLDLQLTASFQLLAEGMSISSLKEMVWMILKQVSIWEVCLQILPEFHHCILISYLFF